MLLLVSRHDLPAHPNIGRLVIPRHMTGVEEHAEQMPWACDNDCFQGLDAYRFRRMLARVGSLPGCLWCAVPDVVADAAATWTRWQEWSSEVARSCPPALVLQDGIDHVPWADLAAVFIGGTTEFKLGRDAALLVRDARRRGLHAHMGRVNSLRRMRYAASIGCTSVDGTKYARWDRAHLVAGLTAISGVTHQTAIPN